MILTSNLDDLVYTSRGHSTFLELILFQSRQRR